MPVGGCATAPPVTAPGLQLRKVVIYRNGVGYFERAGHVESSQVRFRVRKDEIGDFLASLAVLERGGSSVRSASFPLEVEDEPEHQSGDGDDGAPPSPGPRPILPMSGPVDPAPRPGPAPEGARNQRTNDLRTVVMSLDGGQHELQVGYIAATPVWRPSYRLVVDKDGANLQAWGIVQNLSGEDWTNVSLSLIAEAPLAFDASLAEAIIPPRPTVTDGGDVIAVVPQSETSLGQGGGPPAPAAAPAPAMAQDLAAEAEMEEDESGSDAMAGKPADQRKRKAAGAPAFAPPPSRMIKRESAANVATSMSMSMGPGGPAMRPAAPAFSNRARNLSALAAVAVQAGATRYEIPVPISVPDRSATMVLLLDKRVPGATVALFAPDDGVPESAAHPFRVARFTNRTGGLLERGPLAIFSEGAFLGQGMTDPLPDGATATVPFALERSLAVDVSRERREEGARLYHIEGGNLTIARDAVWLTKYRTRNGADQPAKLLVKHARANGARLEHPPVGTEDNVGTGSALVPVSVDGRATVELVVDEREETRRDVDWLSPLADDAAQAYWADRRADPGITNALKAARAIRQILVRATDETRANLKALEKNTAAADLRAKLTKRLGADAARVDELGKKLIELTLRIDENRVRFTEAIRGIKLLTPLPPNATPTTGPASGTSSP
ncbi:MAG: DUF4139 domain-containing protein [Pseudomonadota bacterium]